MPVVPATGDNLRRAFPWWPAGAADYMGFVFDKIAAARMSALEVEEMFQKTTFGKLAHAFRYAEDVTLLRLRDEDPIIVLECQLPTPCIDGPEPSMGPVLRVWISDDSEALLDFVRLRGVFTWGDLQAMGLPALYEVQQRWVKWAYADAPEGVPPYLPSYTERLAAHGYAHVLERFLSDRVAVIAVRLLVFNAGVRLTARDSWGRIASLMPYQEDANYDAYREAFPPDSRNMHVYMSRAIALTALPRVVPRWNADAPPGDFAARAALEMQLTLQTAAGREFRAPDHFMWRSWRTGSVMSEEMRHHHGYMDAPLARVRQRPDGRWEEVSTVVGDFK